MRPGACPDLWGKGMAVNRKQLIEALSAHYEGNRRQAAQALDAVVETITREVARGEKVAITGFGAFEKAVRPARMVRNPRTGERTHAEETSVPRFRPGSQLRDVVSGAKQLPARTLGAARAAGGVIGGRPGSDTSAGSSRPSRHTMTKKPTAGGSTSESATKATAKKATTKKATAKKATAKTPAKKAPAKKTTSGTAKKATSSGGAGSSS